MQRQRGRSNTNVPFLYQFVRPAGLFDGSADRLGPVDFSWRAAENVDAHASIFSNAKISRLQAIAAAFQASVTRRRPAMKTAVAITAITPGIANAAKLSAKGNLADVAAAVPIAEFLKGWRTRRKSPDQKSASGPGKSPLRPTANTRPKTPKSRKAPESRSNPSD